MSRFSATPTASLSAVFRCADEHRRTQMAQLLCKAPLKIAKTLPLENALSLCVMDASPGLLAGDFYEFAWRLEENAVVHIGTQGFTRVHPSRERPCLLRQNISLGEGAHLELFPEPLMLYKGAAFRAESHITLAPGASFSMGEVFCAGRIGRGEVFAFDCYENRLRVQLGDDLIFVAQNALRPQSFAWRGTGAWQDFTHSASFLTFGEHLNATLCDELRVVIDATPDVCGGVSLLEKYGLTASLLGRRAHDLQSVIERLRATVRVYLNSSEKIQSRHSTRIGLASVT